MVQQLAKQAIVINDEIKLVPEDNSLGVYELQFKNGMYYLCIFL